MGKFEKFDEKLTEKLKDLMISQSDKEHTFYDWYAGISDFEEMKRLFMVHFWQTEFFKNGDSQEVFLNFTIDRVKRLERKEEERKARRAKKHKINLEAIKEASHKKTVTGPIYDNDEKPKYYEW